jgi:preprotein translocase subunit SecG
MYGFLLFLFVVIGLFLSVVILLQAGKGGGLAAMGGGGGTGTDGILAGRQASSFLTRATWTSGTLFMVLALVLSIMSSRAQAPESILRDDIQQTAPGTPQPLLPGTGEPTPGGQTPPPGEGGADGGGS